MSLNGSSLSIALSCSKTSIRGWRDVTHVSFDMSWASITHHCIIQGGSLCHGGSEISKGYFHRAPAEYSKVIAHQIISIRVLIYDAEGFSLCHGGSEISKGYFHRAPAEYSKVIAYQIISFRVLIYDAEGFLQIGDVVRMRQITGGSRWKNCIVC
jgi:hypothetical protein